MPATNERKQNLAAPLAQRGVAVVLQACFAAFHDRGYRAVRERAVAGTRLESPGLDADRPRLGFQR
jgi:hypothetical protein